MNKIAHRSHSLICFAAIPYIFQNLSIFSPQCIEKLLINMEGEKTVTLTKNIYIIAT